MSKKKGVNNINCSVYGCHSKKGREKRLSFHCFPAKNAHYVKIVNNFGFEEKICRKKAWEKILLMEKPATRFAKVCSLHFRRDDYILPDFVNKLARLKKNAVPSQNLPHENRLFTTPKVRVKGKNKLGRNYLEASTTTNSIDQEEFSEVSRKCGSLKVEIKTELIEFDSEDLHHSIDIKEETPYL